MKVVVDTEDEMVEIKRSDGKTFIVKPAPKRKSPLAVKGIDLDLTSEEIVNFIHEGRKQ